jgi:hypothetical protein
VIAADHQLRELRACGDLDFVGEPTDDLAKRADRVVVVAAGDQQVGCVPQRPRTAFVGAACDRVVQILQKRLRFVHGESPQFAADAEIPQTDTSHQTREFGKIGKSVFLTKIR